jgi:hypothetical protein
MWWQRSHVQWLTAGDRNIRFFHLRASQRRKKNRISKLKREDDSIATYEIELGDMATKFYRELYKSEGVQGMDEVLASVPNKVSELMNNMLDVPFDSVEVKTMLFEMYAASSELLWSRRPCAWCLTSQLGTPRGRYDECSG